MALTNRACLRIPASINPGDFRCMVMLSRSGIYFQATVLSRHKVVCVVSIAVGLARLVECVMFSRPRCVGEPCTIWKS